MMYGTLEVPKKEKEIQIEKPPFYDFPPDTLTDEQVNLKHAVNFGDGYHVRVGADC